MYLWFGSILKSFFYDQIWILMMFSKVPRFEGERKLNHWPGGRHQVVCSEGQRILLGPRAALKTFKFAWIHHSVLHSTLQQVFCMKTDRFHEMSNTGVSSCRILSSKAETWNVSGQVCVCPCVPLPGQRWWKDDYRFGTRMSFGSLVRKSALLPADMRGCHLHQYSWFAYFLLTTSRFAAQPCAIAEAGMKSLRYTLVHPTAKLSSSNWPTWQMWFQPAPAKNVFFPSKRLYCVVQSQFRKLQPCLASCPDLWQIQILEGKSYFASRKVGTNFHAFDRIDPFPEMLVLRVGMTSNFPSLKSKQPKGFQDEKAPCSTSTLIEHISMCSSSGCFFIHKVRWAWICDRWVSRYAVAFPHRCFVCKSRAPSGHILCLPWPSAFAISSRLT